MQSIELKNSIDLSTLTLPLQQELIDFYQFLIEKQRTQTKEKNIIELLSMPEIADITFEPAQLKVTFFSADLS